MVAAASVAAVHEHHLPLADEADHARLVRAVPARAHQQQGQAGPGREQPEEGAGDGGQPGDVSL